jgi:AmmeMemoRadiSam system radical SAM enzyme
MQYYKQKNSTLVCLLCRHYCTLKPNQVGLCGVNKSNGDAITCLVDSHIAALNIDPVEKKPLYHFLPGSTTLSLGTVGCNFRCSFCQNWGISQEKNIDTSSCISAEQIVQMALKHGCQSIAYTYNEPTIFYPFAKKIALESKQYALKNIYVSNGFQSPEMIEDMKGVIDAFNIDLKSFNPAYYKKLGGELHGVLDNLKRIKALDMHLEVTTLIVPSKNDSAKELYDIASFIYHELGANTPWHISAFHPDYKEQSLSNTPLETLKKAFTIAKNVGLEFVYIGNSVFSNHTVCPKCQMVLIQREGFKVTHNKLHNGACPKCENEIKGVFHES